jgi:DNA repair/transcription protein MET18/MMS19
MLLTRLQKDVLKTLLGCAESYDSSAMSQYSITLWDSLKFEVLSAQEPELAHETLLVLRAIAKCLSLSTQTSTTASPLAQYVRPITKECIEHLQEPTQRQAKASGDILKSVSSANSETFNLIAKSIIPAIVTIYQSSSEIAKRRALLEVLNQLFDSATEVFGTWNSKDVLSRGKNPLEAFSEKLLEIFGQALMSTVKEEVSFRVAAAEGLQKVAMIGDLLQQNEVGMIIQHLDDLVLHEESYGRDGLKRIVMESLAQISKHKPKLIMDITFPAFMAQLPDTDSEAETRGDYQKTLEGLAEISVEKEVSDTLVRRLLNKLDVLLNTHNAASPRYTGALLSTLLFVMERKDLDNDPNLPNYYDRIVVGLVSRATTAAIDTRNLTALNDVAVLEVLGRLSNLIVRRTTPEKKALASANVYDLFSIQSGLKKLSSAAKGSELQNIWILSTWFLAAIPRDLQVPLLDTANISAILSSLLPLLNEEIKTVAFVSILHQFALYINKHLHPSALEVATSQLTTLYKTLALSRHQELVTEQAHSQESLLRVVRAIFTISKALVLRLSPGTNAILEDLMSLLDGSKYLLSINRAAASSFSTLLATDAVLSKTNGAQIRLLAPQKVFRALTPMISAGFKSSSQSAEKENYLTALSGVIATVPSDIVVPELPTLLPLLLQSLDLSDQRVKIATLETLAVVIARNPAAMEESGHITSLVKRLVRTASRSKGSASKDSEPDGPKPRQLAVRCLFLMPGHIKGSGSRTNPLLPLRREVLQGLMNVLDDPKRDVRKEAVDARGAWLRGVDDAEEDSD